MNKMKYNLLQCYICNVKYVFGNMHALLCYFLGLFRVGVAGSSLSPRFLFSIEVLAKMEKYTK